MLHSHRDTQLRQQIQEADVIGPTAIPLKDRPAINLTLTVLLRNKLTPAS